MATITCFFSSLLLLPGLLFSQKGCPRVLKFCMSPSETKIISASNLQRPIGIVSDMCGQNIPLVLMGGEQSVELSQTKEQGPPSAPEENSKKEPYQNLFGKLFSSSIFKF